MAVIPYIFAAGIVDDATVSVGNLLFLNALQSAVIYGLILLACAWIVPKTDLSPFQVLPVWQRIVLPGLVFGTLLGVILTFLGRAFFSASIFSNFQPPAWTGALASLYGGINEEVLLRLFLFTLLYFLLSKMGKNRILILWITNIIIAVMFGFGHLPIAYSLAQPTGFEIFRILLLNGIPGLIFGWLYWSKGFYTAAFAHFVTDIFVHVLLLPL